MVGGLFFCTCLWGKKGWWMVSSAGFRVSRAHVPPPANTTYYTATCALRLATYTFAHFTTSASCCTKQIYQRSKREALAVRASVKGFRFGNNA